MNNFNNNIKFNDSKITHNNNIFFNQEKVNYVYFDNKLVWSKFPNKIINLTISDDIIIWGVFDELKNKKFKVFYENTIIAMVPYNYITGDFSGKDHSKFRVEIY